MPKVRPHFKLHLSLFSHRKTAALAQDNALLATYLRLGCFMMREYAACRDDTVVATVQDLMSITARRHPGYAVKVMEKLCAVTGLEPWITMEAIPIELFASSLQVPGDFSATSLRVSRDVWPNVYKIKFPNFRRKQGFTGGAPSWLSENEPLESESETELKNKTRKPRANGSVKRAKRVVAEAQNAGKSPQERAREMWKHCVEAAAKHGKTWSAKPSAGRIRTMGTRLRDHPHDSPQILVDAIHGAVRVWGGMDRESGDFDPFKFLTPETIYRAANFEKYLEAMQSTDARKPMRGLVTRTIADLEKQWREDIQQEPQGGEK